MNNPPITTLIESRKPRRTTPKKPGTTRVTTPVADQEAAQERLVALIRTEPLLTRKALALAVGLTLDGAKYHLKQLTDAGRVRGVSMGTGGRWEVLV